MKKINNTGSFRISPQPNIKNWVIWLVSCFSFVFSATLIVPTDYPNIQAGIDASVSGDSVLVLDGEYTGEGNYNIVIYNKGITLLSESGPGNCIIDAQGLDRCIGLSSYLTEEINGFIIRNGNAEYGGGINVLGGEHIIKNCIFLNNNATVEGGGIATYMSDPLIENCIFMDNYAPTGPGIGIGNWSDVYVYNSIIYDQISPGIEGGYYSYYCLWSPELQFSLDDNNNIIGDALFVDSDNGNFHLQLESPCINAGSPDSPTDPDGTRNDIGPFYYHLDLQGDTNFDSSINVIDILIVVNIILQETESYNAQLWAADLNGDELINIIDILLIINITLN